MKINQIQKKLKLIVDSTPFNYLSIGVIVFSALLVGLSLDPIFLAKWEFEVYAIELAVLAFFSIEILMRIFAEEKPLNYFKDPWNVFDFIIVAICFIPFKDKAVYVLRLIRVLRTFRLFKAFPNLRPVISGLLNSISSVMFVALLLMMVLYIYGVIGVSLFASIDPLHFGTIWRGLFTLFQVLTLENWNTIMLPANSAYPIGGPLYFISFIILGTMIIMNLFLGVIVGNMSKAMDKLNSPESMKNYLDEDAIREKKLVNKLEKIDKELELIIQKKKNKKKTKK